MNAAALMSRLWRTSSIEGSEPRQPFIERVMADPSLGVLDPAARRLALRSLAQDPAELVEARDLADLIDEAGPLTPFLRDPAVTDVVVNGPFEVWVERAGSLQPVDVRFDSAEHLMAFVRYSLAGTGKQVDASTPLVDARLRSGARIQVVLPPIAPEGPLVSIRRFPAEPLSLEDLVNSGTVNEGVAGRLQAAVEGRRTILVSGATGAGKTTLVGALVGLVGRGERIVLIEETQELAATAPHLVRLVARQGNCEGRGAISLADLVRASLRMRPDRIVVGEVRGPEAHAAIWAMSSGHAGSFLTLHARSAPAALERLVSLAATAAGAPSYEVLRSQAHAAVDLVVHMERAGDRRRVVEILEIDEGTETDGDR